MRNATVRRTPEKQFTETEVQAMRVLAFRAGYGAGGDAYQLELRHKPFLIEDEALDLWLGTPPQ